MYVHLMCELTRICGYQSLTDLLPLKMKSMILLIKKNYLHLYTISGEQHVAHTVVKETCCTILKKWCCCSTSPLSYSCCASITCWTCKAPHHRPWCEITLPSRPQLQTTNIIIIILDKFAIKTTSDESNSRPMVAKKLIFSKILY